MLDGCIDRCLHNFSLSLSLYPLTHTLFSVPDPHKVLAKIEKEVMGDGGSRYTSSHHLLMPSREEHHRIGGGGRKRSRLHELFGGDII